MGYGEEFRLIVNWSNIVIVDEVQDGYGTEEDVTLDEFGAARRACEEAKDSIVNGTATIFVVVIGDTQYAFDVEEDWDAKLVSMRKVVE